MSALFAVRTCYTYIYIDRFIIIIPHLPRYIVFDYIIILQRLKIFKNAKFTYLRDHPSLYWFNIIQYYFILINFPIWYKTSNRVKSKYSVATRFSINYIISYQKYYIQLICIRMFASIFYVLLRRRQYCYIIGVLIITL